jgi:branched-chain amino acid transport system permease protein
MQKYAASLPLLDHGNGGGIPVGDASRIFYGVAIIVFLVVEPRGVVGLSRRIARLLNKRRAEPAAPAAAA